MRLGWIRERVGECQCALGRADRVDFSRRIDNYSISYVCAVPCLARKAGDTLRVVRVGLVSGRGVKRGCAPGPKLRFVIILTSRAKVRWGWLDRLADFPSVVKPLHLAPPGDCQPKGLTFTVRCNGEGRLLDLARCRHPSHLIDIGAVFDSAGDAGQITLWAADPALCPGLSDGGLDVVSPRDRFLEGRFLVARIGKPFGERLPLPPDTRGTSRADPCSPGRCG